MPSAAKPNEEAAVPSDLTVKLAEQRLLIDWTDGKRSEFALADLRRVCPCATCRTEREAQSTNPLQVLKADPTTEVRVTQANLIGNYAIQLHWSDGHKSGIFEFRFLRSLGSK